MKKLMIAFLVLINTVLLYADSNIRNNAFDPSTPAGQMTYNLLSSDDCKEISEDEKEIKEKEKEEERESAVCVILIIVFLMICSTITMLIDDHETKYDYNAN